ncbi:MAG: DUF433 domain-containing protein [Candidatus Omnitrophota bacterium]
MINKSRNSIIQSVKEILGGEPVFRGTRVSVRTLIEYLEAGDCLDDFLKDYPTVKKKQAIEVLELVKKGSARG